MEKLLFTETFQLRNEQEILKLEYYYETMDLRH